MFVIWRVLSGVNNHNLCSIETIGFMLFMNSLTVTCMYDSRLTIVGIVFASWMGQIWFECTIDVAHSTVCVWSTIGISASVATGNCIRTSTAAHVCHASSVDRICYLHNAVSWPSLGTFCLCHSSSDLPQPWITGATVWAWTLLHKVCIAVCIINLYSH